MAGGDIKGAKAAWNAAYEMSRVVCGPDTAATNQLKRLRDKTPKNVSEMMFNYQNMGNLLDEIEYEEDAESADVMRQFADSSFERKKKASTGNGMGDDEEDEGDEDDEEDDDDEGDEDENHEGNGVFSAP